MAESFAAGERKTVWASALLSVSLRPDVRAVVLPVRGWWEGLLQQRVPCVSK